MWRFKAVLGAAAALCLVLIWVWPDQSEPSEGDRSAEPVEGPGTSAEPTSAEPTDRPDGSSGEPSGDPGDGTPSAPATSAVPSATRAAQPEPDAFGGPMGTRDRTGGAAVALTFDDGPDPEWTPLVLAELRERGVKATFCLIGAYAESHPELVADIAHDGHTLCNHTWFHEFGLGELGEAEIEANLRRTNEAIERAVPGARIEHFRHPGGKWTPRAVRVAEELGMESVHWTVDPSDWDPETTADEIRERVAAGVGPGAIVLLHDGASNQAAMLEALGPILDRLERRGHPLVAL